MNRKKVAAAALALALVGGISVTGTLAYLTAQQNDGNAVTNTFIAAGGGKLIDPTNGAPTADGQELKPGFFLVESKYEYKEGEYVLDETERFTLSNTYEKVAPGMKLPKNPTLVVNLVEGAEAYIFVKVTDTTDDNMTAQINSTDWEEVGNIEGDSNAKLYVYKRDGKEIQVGVEGQDIDSNILAENVVNVRDFFEDDKGFTDVSDEDGVQLGEITFEAYVCQAGGFKDAAAAFEACFNEKVIKASKPTT